MPLHLDTPAHAILKTDVWYVTHLKHFIVCFPFACDFFIFYTIDNDNDSYKGHLKQYVISKYDKGS